MCIFVFRGLGLGISKGELAAYDKRVFVFFQKCRVSGRRFFYGVGESLIPQGSVSRERRCNAVGAANPYGRQLARVDDGRVQEVPAEPLQPGPPGEL